MANHAAGGQRVPRRRSGDWSARPPSMAPAGSRHRSCTIGPWMRTRPAVPRTLVASESTANGTRPRLGTQAATFPRLSHVRSAQNGEVRRVGALTITADLLPGHTPSISKMELPERPESPLAGRARRVQLSRGQASDPRFSHRCGPARTRDLFQQVSTRWGRCPATVYARADETGPHINARVTKARSRLE